MRVDGFLEVAGISNLHPDRSSISFLGTHDFEGQERVWDGNRTVSTRCSGSQQQAVGEGEPSPWPAVQQQRGRAIELHVKINMGSYGDGLEAQGTTLTREISWESMESAWKRAESESGDTLKLHFQSSLYRECFRRSH